MEALFLKTLNMSITASYVVLAVLVIRLFLRNAPKIYSYLLWIVVGFRFCSPVSFASVISIFNAGLFNMTVAQSGGEASLNYIPVDIGYMAVPKVTVGIPVMNTVISGSLPVATPAASVNPMQIWILLGTGLWCVGVAAMLIYSIVTFVRLKRRMATAVRMENCVFESDQIRSPFVLGFSKPAIYLPFGLGEPEKGYILLHESGHLQRRDHLVKPLAFLVLAMHWFNPLAWLAFRLMGRDMEMSCDEKVLALAGPGIIKDYSKSILALAANRWFPSASPLAFGETDIKGRVKNVLRFRKPKRWAAVIAAMLCLMVVAACAANPKRSAGVPEISEMYGTYRFAAAVYMNPLSSFYPFDGYVEYYTFTEDALVITDITGTKTGVPAKYEKVAVDAQAFKAAFNIDIGVPDIAKYKERYQYILNDPASANPAYQLYRMDGEVWLARLNRGSIWSIFKLTRFEGNIAEDVSTNQAAVTVVSGNNTVSALVYDSPSNTPLQDLKDQVNYLRIDLENNMGKIEPFSVYADGVEQFGSYNIFDAETMEALDFISPSGLSPQTYLLVSTEKGHSYLVELSVGEWDAKGENVVGNKFIFGVTIPE